MHCLISNNSITKNYNTEEMIGLHSKNKIFCKNTVFYPKLDCETIAPAWKTRFKIGKNIKISICFWRLQKIKTKNRCPSFNKSLRPKYQLYIFTVSEPRK
jgi:hypothetical protein